MIFFSWTLPTILDKVSGKKNSDWFMVYLIFGVLTVSWGKYLVKFFNK